MNIVEVKVSNLGQNKLDTYKYTFIKDNEEYHFDSISN